MVKRIAAHYLYHPTGNSYKLHYVEITDSHRLLHISPLTQEIAGTLFYNGILLILKENYSPDELFTLLKNKNETFPDLSVFALLDKCNFEEVHISDKIHLFLLDGIDLLSAKFGTGNSSGNSYVQRLC